MKMNKRAEISIIILILGVVAICILTIFSFVGVNNERKGDFLGIGLIETMNSIEEEFNFYGRTKFKSGDYKNNIFERGNEEGKVIIEISGNIMNGYYPNKEKRIVFVKYEFESK